MRRLLFALFLCLSAAPRAQAQEQTVVAETADDRMVREIAQQLRCAVCQNESVADSGSTLARNMRAIIREQVELGKSETEIKAYFVSRYGDYILMEPRKAGFNWLLWGFPFVALAAGLLFVAVRYLRRPGAEATQAAAKAEAAAESDDSLIAALRRPSSENTERE